MTDINVSNSDESINDQTQQNDMISGNVVIGDIGDSYNSDVGDVDLCDTGTELTCPGRKRESVYRKWFIPPGHDSEDISYCEYCYTNYIKNIDRDANNYTTCVTSYGNCDFNKHKYMIDKITKNYTYFCGGIIDNLPFDLKLFYYDKLQNNAHFLKFPIEDQIELHDLICNGAKATFGKGEDEILDDNYRQALVIDQENFSLNIDNITDYVISDIHTKLMCHIDNIFAEKYKLNIYTEGGFFNDHQDTPSSPNMFGSLVICLPTHFTGGALVLKKDDNIKRFDWDKNCDKIQWAAFFGDIVHNVEKVTSGNRITLTYKLYNSNYIPSDTCVKQNVVSELDILNFKTFIDNVCKIGIDKIGIGCKYMYTMSESYKINNANSLADLKGSDAILFELLSKIGMDPKVESITFDEKDDDEDNSGEDDSDETFKYGHFWITNPEDNVDDNDSHGDDHNDYFISNKYTYKRVSEKIKWINNPKEGERGISGKGRFVYGNYPASSQEFYKLSVILCNINTYMANVIKSSLKNYLSNDMINYVLMLVIDQ